jgi:hypothetical protein
MKSKIGSIEIGTINKLTDKQEFNVSDLIKILNSLNENAPIQFGVLGKKGICFCQNENFMFRLTYPNREDEWEGNYTLQIITDGSWFEKQFK